MENTVAFWKWALLLQSLSRMKQLAKFAFFLFLVEQIKSMKTQDGK